MKNEVLQGLVKKILVVVICCAVALLSIFVVGKKASTPESYAATIQSIDEKKATVMGVTTTAAVASTALASVAGDATTPIANEIMDISSCLIIVVCALVLEKSLLTIFGYISFNIMIPVACGLFAIAFLSKRSLMKMLSVKIVVFALVLATVIPFSLKISDMIYESNTSTIEALNEKVEGMNGENEDKETDKSWWSNFVENVKDGVSKVIEGAKQLVNNFIDVIALFIIAYCAIPVVVFLVVIWFIKFLFNISVPLPSKEKLQSLRMNRKNVAVGELKEEE